jgi:hypothetical protein
MNIRCVGVSLLVATVTASVARGATAVSDQPFHSNAARLEYAQNGDDNNNGSDVVVPPIHPGQTPGNGPVNGPTSPTNGQLGNICYTTPRDGVPGPYAPVGARCYVTLPNGTRIPGNIGVAGQLPPVLPMPGAQ